MSDEPQDNSLIYPHIHALLQHLESERNYLYSVIINLMVELGKSEITFTEDDKEFSSDFNTSILLNRETKEIYIKIERMKEQKL